MVRVDGNVAIVGDIHGQLYDLFYMLNKVQVNSRGIGKLVFMGDYVDRGMYGPEVVAYLCAMKLANPHDVIMLRGNHETRQCTTDFNFRDQCVQHYDEETYDNFMDFFDELPIAATVNGKYFAVHGGISRELTSIASINEIDRRIEPEEGSLLSDMLWADPMPEKLANSVDFIENRARGTSYNYGKRPLKRLLKQARLQSMIRAHEVQ